METCELTILMPCLNEAETLSRCIQKAKSFLQIENIKGEILIADNGSTDGSQLIAEEAGARVINVATRGYGAALKSGIAAARGQYVVMGDADDSYDFQSLGSFVDKLRDGYDLVMGNRFRGGIQKGAMPFLNRYLGNPVLSMIGRILFKSNIGDFHCGLRGFSRERFSKLNLQGDGMEFASEMVVKATLNHYKITEVPTSLHPDGRSRKPHLRPWRDGWRHLRLLLLFCPRWLFFYPGLTLLGIGFLLMSVLSFGKMEVNHVNFDIHTMLFAALFMIVGAQSLCFSISTSLIANDYLSLSSSSLFLKRFSLEKGLLFGVLLILCGGWGALYTVFYWAQLTFGELVPSHVMRILIPSVTAIILGVQLIFSSFFLSMLKMYQRDRVNA